MMNLDISHYKKIHTIPTYKFVTFEFKEIKRFYIILKVICYKVNLLLFSSFPIS